jgi:hypothetical protein
MEYMLVKEYKDQGCRGGFVFSLTAKKYSPIMENSSTESGVGEKSSL